jgi:Predicted NTPase (NACHT family)
MISAGGVFKVALPAAQKAGTLIFQKMSRLRRIDEALKGNPDQSILQKAISDFEIIKGTWRGEFTVTVDHFLRAFEASGMSEAMFNNALIQNRSPALKTAFIELFKSETGQCLENGEILYKQIIDSFEISCEMLSKDQVLSKVIKASHRDIVSNILSIESSIDHIKAGLLSRPSDEAINEAIPRILRAVAGDTKYIRVETSQGRKDVEITKIYIAPRLSIRNIDKIAPIIKILSETANEDQDNGDGFTLSISKQRSLFEQTLRSVDMSELKNLPRVVVLGNPGGGKSTLLQCVCNRLASESIKALSDGAKPNDVIVPIRIILRDFEHARIASPQLNLIDYIANDLLNAAYSDKAALTHCIENLLASGRAYLAFDGLDEILKTANRRQFVDIVNRFVRQYPLCRVLVTSREIGYDNAPLPSDEYEELILGEFADEDVSSYAERFIRHVGRKKAAEAREAARHFMSQTAQNAQDLRRNPLMLGLMMWIFNIRDDVPSNRPEIYRECARLMFERWDGERGIIVELPQTFDRLQVFSHLASKIFDDDDYASGVSSKWIESEIKSHLCEVLESAPHAQAAAKSMVQFIVDRSWVMSEKGEGVFSFTHQTFLEYFFATFNDDTFDSITDLLNTLLPHIRIEEWDVVSRLSLQIKSDRNRRRQDEAMNLLVNELRSELNRDAKQAVVGYSVRCLEFLIGSEANVRSLIYAILDAMNDCYQSGIIDSTESVPSLFSGARERRQFIADAVESWLEEKFKDGSDEDRDFVLAVVDGSTGKFKNFGEIQSSCNSTPIHLVKRYRGKLLPILNEELSSSPKSARILYEWTGTIPKTSLNNFGASFINYARPPVHIELNGISAMVLAATGIYADIFSGTNFTKDKASASLATFGHHWKKVGIDGLSPFPRDKSLNDPPLRIWANLLRNIKATDDLRLAAIVACYLEINNAYQADQGPNGDRYLLNEIRRISKLIKRSGDAGSFDIVVEIIQRIENIFNEWGKEEDL